MTEPAIEIDIERREQRVDELLGTLVELLGQIDALSQRQGGLIEEGDTDRLLGLLAERGRAIGELETATRAFEPYRENWAETVAGVEPSRVRVWEERLDAMTRTGRAIGERDAASCASLEEARGEILGKLGGVGTKRRAVGAYGPETPRNGLIRNREG